MCCGVAVCLSEQASLASSPGFPHSACLPRPVLLLLWEPTGEKQSSHSRSQGRSADGHSAGAPGTVRETGTDRRGRAGCVGGTERKGSSSAEKSFPGEAGPQERREAPAVEGRGIAQTLPLSLLQPAGQDRWVTPAGLALQ